MISRRQLGTLVERVLLRLTEDRPAVANSNKTPRRYHADGTSGDDTAAAVNPTAKTQMPATLPPMTIPAAKSKEQTSADAELAGLNTKNPRSAAPSQKQIKVKSIKRELERLGYTHTRDGAMRTTQALGSWYDALDPADALVSTADELATRFSNEG